MDNNVNSFNKINKVVKYVNWKVATRLKCNAIKIYKSK